MSKKKVLLIDDDKDICEILSINIENILGECEFTYAYDGREALICIRDQTFDYMFFDLFLPYLDGSDLIKRTRKLEQHKGANIFVISGNINYMARRCLKELHVTGLLDKPFTPDKFKEMIENPQKELFDK